MIERKYLQLYTGFFYLNLGDYYDVQEEGMKPEVFDLKDKDNAQDRATKNDLLQDFS